MALRSSSPGVPGRARSALVTRGLSVVELADASASDCWRDPFQCSENQARFSLVHPGEMMSSAERRSELLAWSEVRTEVFYYFSVTSTHSQQLHWFIYMSRAAQGDCGRMSFSPEGSGLSASEAGEPRMFPSQTLSGKLSVCQTHCMKLTSWTWECETRPALMWHSSGQQLESHDQNGACLRNLTNALIVLHTQYQVKNICNPNNII